MGPVYSKRLATTVTAPGTVTAIVPAGKVWVIKGIDVFNVSAGSTDNCVVRILGTTYIAVFQESILPATRVGHWEGMQVINGGEKLELIVGTGTWHMTVSGYELSAS